jgi:hypothetical protein
LIVSEGCDQPPDRPTILPAVAAAIEIIFIVAALSDGHNQC